MKVELFNAGNTIKAIIYPHRRGYYYVEYYRWTQEMIPECNFVSAFYWEPVLFPSIAETLEEAQEIARDMLKILV